MVRKAAIASGDPAQLPMLQGSIDITFAVSSAWFAIDYDAALSGTISPSTLSMMLIIA